MRVPTLIVLLLVPALAGCTDGDTEPADQVIIQTSMGDITIDLDADAAPKTVENFLKYIDDDFYDGTLFHRIVADFMIQGGGMDTDGQFKTPTYDPVVNEAASSGLKNEKYTIAMARTSAPDSATNQFFINHADNSFLDPSGASAGYTVFGRVSEGQDVVDAIASVPTTRYPGPSGHCQDDGAASCPLEDVIIHSIHRVGDDPAPVVTPPEPVVCPSAAPAQTADDIVLDGSLQAGLITPHVWNVCGSEDQMLLWAHNSADAAVDVPLSATIDGADPAAGGWTLTFEDASLSMEPFGSKSGRDYTDWAHTVMHLTVPDGAEGEHALNVTVGDVVVQATLIVQGVDAETLQSGDSATLDFNGTYSDSGESFYAGTFPSDIGAGRLVTGVDKGLFGVGYQETVHLVVPPALAYGYDNADGSGYEKFNGEWLTFKVVVEGM